MTPTWLGTSEAFAQVVGLALLGLLLTATIIAVAVRQQRRLLQARQSFTAHLIAAQDEERAAIARELHDDIVQRIISMGTVLRTKSPDAKLQVAQRLDRLADDVRGLARGMHPSVIDHMTLYEALQLLAHQTEEVEGIHVAFDGTPGEDALPEAARLSLYRVAQEALGNAARHSGSTEIRMSLDRGTRSTMLDVVDHGAGFDTSAAIGTRGIGLTSMRERIEMLGGRVRIKSVPGHGTHIHATLTHFPEVSP